MAKRCLIKKLCLLFIVIFWGIPTIKAEELSPLYVNLADATSALEVGNQDEVERLMQSVKAEFEGIIASTANVQGESQMEAVQSVQEALEATHWDQPAIVKVTKALVAYEKSLNPIDIQAQRTQFLKQFAPAMDKFTTVLTSQSQDTIRETYVQLNKSWTANESLLRDSEPGFYGKIETQLALLRVAIEAQPFEPETVKLQFNTLQDVINQLQSGENIVAPSNDYTLNDGIILLEQALAAFKQQSTSEGTQAMQRFIEIWPSIEGNISTQNEVLYHKIEAETPIIMANGFEETQQQQLSTLIEEMKAIDPNRQYNRYDVGLIILREGLEAMLIIAALMSSVVALGDRRGKLAIIQGSLIGLFASFLVASILGMALPLLFASIAREVLEGVVGIIAVMMMLVVGIWLHRRATLKTWQHYLEQQLSHYQKSGRLYVLIALSALAVFREGAESILFLVGIVPNISVSELVIGIVGACVILVVAWIAFRLFATKFQPYRLFGILSWFIYALTFKMIGVSIYKLQFTKMIPTHSLVQIPSISSLGIYPTVESIMGQLLLVVIVVVIVWRIHHEQEDVTHES